VTWEPRPRPAWVTALNDFGRVLGSPRALVDLDQTALERAAIDAAGGLDDFGDDDWREPLAVFLRALDDEADLHLVGRLMARNDVVRSLRNRLLLHETVRRHPQVVERPILAPVLVTGTGRSGTSLLHELLACDPDNRSLRTWEALHPVPPPERSTYDHDPRIALAHAEYATFWNAVTPEYASMHDNRGDAPQEDTVLVNASFRSDHLMGSYHVPSYAAWLARADLVPAFALHRRALQVLQWRCPPDRWVLKWPGILSRLADFFAAYPDAIVVIAHRDPMKVLPSMASLMATLQWQHSETVAFDDVVRTAVGGTALVLDHVDRRRAEGRLDDDRIVDVRYPDLVADPIGAVRVLYDRFGRTLTDDAEAAMRALLADRPRDRAPAHAYSWADTGLDPDEARARFAPYLARHGLDPEP
jgi:hypothetical protein